VAIKHAFVSAIADGSRPDLVQASNWNADHVLDAGTITDTHVAAANKDGTSGTPSLRTLGTGASQASAGNHTHDDRYFRLATAYGPGRLHPSNCSHLSTTRATTSAVAYATYMGRCPFTLSSIVLYYSVTTGTGGTITYAEWAFATGAPLQGADPSLTFPAQTVGNVAAQINAIGSYSCTITPAVAIDAGTDFWLVYSSQQTAGAPVIRAHTGNNPHDLGDGATRAAFRPSINTGAAFTFTRDTTEAQMWPVIRV